MSLNPDPWLAEQLLRRWCPVGKEVLVVAQRHTSAAHLYTQLPGTQVMLPVSVQVADLLERYLDRNGAVRMGPRETAADILEHLATRLYGEPRALVLSLPTPPAPRSRRPRGP